MSLWFKSSQNLLSAIHYRAKVENDFFRKEFYFESLIESANTDFMLR